MELKNSYNLNKNINFCAITSKERMAAWRAINKIQSYTDAAYTGYTGAKQTLFPVTMIGKKDRFRNLPDITNDLHLFEEDVLQEIKDTKRKPFGFARVLWKMCQNFGTGECWDTKFLPEFPGRNKAGQVQFAKYKNKVVTGNDISNIFFGHTCKFLGFPEKLALLLAKLDASGILEPFSKGRLPTKELLRFRDTPSDQQAILRGMREFDINDYRLR